MRSGKKQLKVQGVKKALLNGKTILDLHTMLIESVENKNLKNNITKQSNLVRLPLEFFLFIHNITSALIIKVKGYSVANKKISYRIIIYVHCTLAYFYKEIVSP